MSDWNRTEYVCQECGRVYADFLGGSYACSVTCMKAAQDAKRGPFAEPERARVLAEVVLPRHVKPQPTPALYPAGDCGACVLGGLLDLEVADVYARFHRDGRVEPFSHLEIKQACYRAQADGLLDRLITDVPRWPAPDSVIAFGEGSWMRSLEWFHYVRMAIDAGYYALCAVNSERGGPFHPLTTDHFVLLVGARQREEWPEGQKFGRIYSELLVSCSSTSRPSSGWVEASMFLRERGGYNAILARPA